VVREVPAQHRLVEGVTGPLSARVSVHINQAGHQPAAVGHGLGVRGGVLAEHAAVDPH
jgi:hypothetical protein